jgi:hypothetical protein
LKACDKHGPAQTVHLKEIITFLYFFAKNYDIQKFVGSQNEKLALIPEYGPKLWT